MKELFFVVRLAIFPFHFAMFAGFAFLMSLLFFVVTLVCLPFLFIAAACKNDPEEFKDICKGALGFATFIEAAKAEFRWLETGEHD